MRWAGRSWLLMGLWLATAGLACGDDDDAPPGGGAGTSGRAGAGVGGGPAGSSNADTAGAGGAGGAGGAAGTSGTGGAAGAGGAAGGGGVAGGANVALSLQAPRPGQIVTARRAWVRGTIEGGAGVTGLTYQVNGADEVAVALEPSAGGAFGFSVALGPGANEIVVRAGGAEARRSFSHGNRTAAGGLHTGALRSAGVHAWGRNNRGQVGLGPDVTADQYAPALVPAFGDIGWLWFSQNSSLAVGRDGSLWAWGENDDGQLGLGVSGDDQPSPTASVVGLTDVIGAGLGATHVLAERSDGSLFVWGWSAKGSLGGGDALLQNWPYPEPIALPLAP